MKQMTCPLNGLRNMDEFIYGGPLKSMPATDAPAQAWADYTFGEDNAEGRVFEWWLHTPSSFWFIAERDTVSDEVIRTMAFADLQATASVGQ